MGMEGPRANSPMIVEGPQANCLVSVEDPRANERGLYLDLCKCAVCRTKADKLVLRLQRHGDTHH